MINLNVLNTHVDNVLTKVSKGIGLETCLQHDRRIQCTCQQEYFIDLKKSTIALQPILKCKAASYTLNSRLSL